jgi:hypothetical protein
MERRRKKIKKNIIRVEKSDMAGFKNIFRNENKKIKSLPAGL